MLKVVAVSGGDCREGEGEVTKWSRSDMRESSAQPVEVGFARGATSLGPREVRTRASGGRVGTICRLRGLCCLFVKYGVWGPVADLKRGTKVWELISDKEKE